MAMMFHRASVEAVFPSCVGGFIKGFLNKVPEDPKHTRGGESCGNHHDEFVSERALHRAF
jgi:hypothetical protein